MLIFKNKKGDIFFFDSLANGFIKKINIENDSFIDLFWKSTLASRWKGTDDIKENRGIYRTLEISTFKDIYTDNL